MSTLRVQQPAWARDVFALTHVNGEPVRYRVAKGGRGSSKSHTFARRLLIRAACERLTILCTRELQKSIKDSVHKLLTSQIELMGLEDYFDWDKTHLVSKSGSEFLYYGLRYNPDEIKSMEGIDVLWMEEAQGVSQNSLDMAIPTIRKPGSEIWATYNPKLASDPIHNMFVIEGRSNAIVKHVNYSDNPWFPEVLRVEMEQLRAANPKLAMRIWDGQIVDIGGGDYFPSGKANIIDEAPRVTRMVRAWDLAATEPSHDNPDPDWTAGVLMGIDEAGRVVIFDVERGRVNADRVRNKIKRIAAEDAQRCKTTIRIPQDPGQAGKEQAASYKRMLAGYSVKTERVTGDKETRSEALSAEWQAGNVYLVRGDWNEDYISIMNAFPTKEVHDDDVDASNDAYSELKHGNSYNLSNL